MTTLVSNNLLPLRSDVVFRAGGLDTAAPARRTSADADPAEITVLVTVYNYARYVEATLRSVADSTFADLSLVVVDDRSSDESLAVVRTWLEARADRFRECLVLRNADNYGVTHTRNLGLERVRSPFVFVLDADNLVYPTALAKLREACGHAGAAAAYSQLEIFGDDIGVGSADVWRREGFEHQNYVDAMALFRTSALREVGGYGIFEVDGYEDYDVWCKFIEAGLEAVFVPQILCRYRVHGKSKLRIETHPSIDVVATEMIFRHPWLKLDRLTGKL